MQNYCNTDLEKSIAFTIVILFPLIAIAILLASIANNPAVLTLLSYNNTVKIFATRSVFHGYKFSKMHLRLALCTHHASGCHGGPPLLTSHSTVYDRLETWLKPGTKKNAQFVYPVGK